MAGLLETLAARVAERGGHPFIVHEGRRVTYRELDALVNRAANAVSSPVVPIAASSNGTSFSWRAWGAWSVATQSITPRRSASTSATRSASERSGGFILNRLSSVRTTSSVSVR